MVVVVVVVVGAVEFGWGHMPPMWSTLSLVVAVALAGVCRLPFGDAAQWSGTVDTSNCYQGELSECTCVDFSAFRRMQQTKKTPRQNSVLVHLCIHPYIHPSIHPSALPSFHPMQSIICRCTRDGKHIWHAKTRRRHEVFV